MSTAVARWCAALLLAATWSTYSLAAMDPALVKMCRESYERAKSEHQRNPQAPEPPKAMLTDFNACATFTQLTWPQWVASTRPAPPPMRTQEDRDREGLLYLRLPTILASLLVAALAFLHLQRLKQKRSAGLVLGSLVVDRKRQVLSQKANIIGAAVGAGAMALDWRLFGLFCTALAWFGYVATFFLFKGAPSKTFGSARFASLDEVERWNAEAKAATNKGATVRLGLAHPAEDEGEPGPTGIALAYRTDKHVLVVASAGSGKGRDLLIPNLLSYPGPVFVLDPKGENAMRTGRHRESYGPVCYLDPWGITGRTSSGFNPLAELAASNSLEEVATGAAVIASALVMPNDGPNRHFSDSARQLLEGLIAFVVTEPNLRPVADLTIVRQLLTQRLRPTLEAMAASTGGPDVIRSRAGTMLALSDGKEFSSIISTAATETDFIDNPTLQKNLGLDGVEAIDFGAWQRGIALSVYLCVPLDLLGVYNRWLRLIAIGALRAMTKRLNPPQQSVMFMLDELAALGRMKPLEDAVGAGRGYGVQVWAVFQDLAQMKDTYKEKWPTFPGNAGLRCFFGVQDFDTAKYVSDMLGEATVEATSTSTAGGNSNTTTSSAKRQLRTPDEVMRDEGMFVLPPSSAPIYIERVAYFKDPELAGRWDEV